jgi:TetR/AcrR family transcriptional regulator, regulator of autoinduction and epiphytic fitness
MAAVKTQGTPRRERARATRRRIVESAYRLFTADGYPSTTMDAIAAEAGVAVQTVYHVFHTKAELLKEVVQVANAGNHDAPPATEPSWMREVRSASDGRRALALSVEHGTDMFARVAPLIGAISAAASTDPEIGSYWGASCQVRRDGMAQIVAVLAASGQLRRGLSPERAADIMYAITGHETFLILLTECGWSVEEIKAWYYGMLCDQLVSVDRRQPASGTSPTQGLSFDHFCSG